MPIFLDIGRQYQKCTFSLDQKCMFVKYKTNLKFNYRREIKSLRDVITWRQFWWRHLHLTSREKWRNSQYQVAHFFLDQ